MVEIIAVVNLKGGSAKTTTTAYLAHAYARNRRHPLVVDADPQGSALRWSEQGEWSVPTIALPVKNLHTRLSGIVPPEVDTVFIDTPPLDEQAGIVYSSLRAANIVIVTMAPTMAEYERLPDVWAAIDEVEPLRDHAPEVAVLLNRTVANAASTGTFRDQLTEDGHRVLSTTIPRREAIAQAFGGPVSDLGKYADAAAEIQKIGAAA